MLIPPDNFGMVEPGVYRCSKLEADHLPFLETLRLKLLVLLDVAKPPRTLKLFLEANRVDLYSLGGLKILNHQNTGPLTHQNSGGGGLEPGGSAADGGRAPLAPATRGSGIAVVLLPSGAPQKNDLWMIIEKNLVVAACGVILDRTKHSVLVVDSSLALVGILRKIQKWNFNSIVNEYRMYTGNASKISYNVEVFLELVQIELVPAELGRAASEPQAEPARALHHGGPACRRPLALLVLLAPVAPVALAQNAPQRSASDDAADVVFDDDDALSLGDYDDDDDDNDALLSASPQIPANLLRLVEQRKNDVPSPASSPTFRRRLSSSGARASSTDLPLLPAAFHRRKSSVESRYLRALNTRFRDPLATASSSPALRRASFDPGLRAGRIDVDRALGDEMQRLRASLGYRYYQPMGAPADSFNVIKVRIPAEQNLPSWFVQARDFWEQRLRG